jgi:hypothetical protein
MKFRHIALLAGALLIASPIITVLPGCGGGGSGPSLPAQTINDLPINLGNGQTGELDLTISVIPASGTGQVNAVLQVNPDGQPGTQRIPAGTYNGVGTIDTSRNFSVIFDLPEPPGDLTMTGRIPTTSQTGTYTVRVGNLSQSGTFPALGTLR